MVDLSTRTGKAKLTGIVGGAAAGLIAVVGAFEGYSADPYLDVVSIKTVCFGETNVEMRHYTRAECEDMLANSLSDYASAVLKRNPELKGHDAQMLAASSLAYNAGIANYRKSTVAKRFSQGRWLSACNAFRSWVYAGGRKIQGLVNRREKEIKICKRDIPPEYAS